MGSICRGMGSRSAPMGIPPNCLFFKFNTKCLCGIGMGSRFDADLHLKDHEEIGEAIEHAIRANAGPQPKL